MAVNTSMKAIITSKRTGNKYSVYRFSEYNVDIDLETDADTFDFVIKNPNGIYSGLFSKFDPVTIMVNGKTIMKGNIDMVVYIDTDEDDYIQISGRDKCWKLIDNDALPDTIENVQPKQYIEKKCNSYGIKHSVSKASIYKKLVIGCGESEISIMNNILLDDKQRIWYLVDTLYTGTWGIKKKSTHTFIMHTSKVGIPIETFKLSEDGTDMKSEVRVYGSNDGKFELAGSYKNQYMNKLGIIKRKVRRSYSDKASSKYTSIAKEDVRETFRDNAELTIGVRLDEKNHYMPNTVCTVVNGRCKVNATFFIRRVTYSKSPDSGSKATLIMIPTDSTFEKTWQAKGCSVTGLTKASKAL